MLLRSMHGSIGCRGIEDGVGLNYELRTAGAGPGGVAGSGDGYHGGAPTPAAAPAAIHSAWPGADQGGRAPEAGASASVVMTRICQCISCHGAYGCVMECMQSRWQRLLRPVVLPVFSEFLLTTHLLPCL